ncbi:DUF6082 family protein [Streptomyces sp. NPDC013161]|uniref:DUF6082 family protein n=1 Tax=Streptomyces sp. NPDC013161 TaxID=3364862 RepID=UPI0036B6087E
MAMPSHIREVCVLGITTLAACVGSVGLTMLLTSLSTIQSTATSNAGQAYGAAAAVTSVVVLFYIARTFRHQNNESRMNREVISLQREDAQIHHDAMLERSSQAMVQGQHLKLLQMAIDDPLLMECWPNYGANGVPDELRRQYMYCNLIISHHYTSYELGNFTDAEVEETLRYTFKSAVIRNFWDATRFARSRTAPHGGTMRKFYDMAELAYLSNQEDGEGVA